MAKGKATPPAAGKLAGKTVAFVGKFGYRDWNRSLLQRAVQSEGGAVVEPTATPDYLVYGEGRGGNPPGDVAKIQKKHPAVQVHSFTDFAQLVALSADEFVRMLTGPPKPSEWWEDFSRIAVLGGISIDLRGADLRKANLEGAKLEQIRFDGANFKGAHIKQAEFGKVQGADFDGAGGEGAGFDELRACTFRKANLPELQLGTIVEGCDFSGAAVPKLTAHHIAFKNCSFAGADLSGAEIYGCKFPRLDLSGVNFSGARSHSGDFDDAILTRASFAKAELRNASFKKADLRNADFRGANLTEANFAGANVAGADFAGATLTAAKIDKLDASKAKNFKPPVDRTPGPQLAAFAAAIGAKTFTASIEVDTTDGGRATLTATYTKGNCWANSRYANAGTDHYDQVPAGNLTQGMFRLADRWPGATPRFDTAQAKGSASVRGKELTKLAIAAWAEAFGVETASEEELKKLKQERADKDAKERETLIAKIRATGTAAWNDLSFGERQRLNDFSSVDFSGIDLSEIQFNYRIKLENAKFAGSKLVEAMLTGSNSSGANFDAADLHHAMLQCATLTGASFKKADLTDADLSNAKLQGANFTGAKLAGAKFDHAEYDEGTKFPPKFEPPISMIWKGAPKPVAPIAVGSLDFPTFLANLGQKVEAARMQKAGSMLKAERFQLFAEVKDDSVVGIVKSQSSRDLVYSCRLTSSGDFGCCTQNLMACGGLRGALCKHLLVLIVGLTKAGQLDPATVNAWADASRAKKPAMDKDIQSESFLKYKGAEAGEVDWRPTETIPEDFYAM